MSRQEMLNDALEPIIHNRKCSHKELNAYLDQCESVLINTVFEEKHGEKLYLDHLITHLQDLIDDKGLSDDERVIEMINNLESFKVYIKDVKKGTKGERFARKALDKLTIPSNILESVQLSIDDINTEDDIIVINKNGLFIIEVKYSDNDMCITKDGFYVPNYNRNVSLGTRNVLDQVSNERHVLMNALSKKSGILDLQELSKKVHGVVLFANKKHRLFDESNSGIVKYCYNISSYISDFNQGLKLSNDEVEEYTNLIRECEVSKEYDIDFDLDQLRTSFIEGLCILENEIVTDQKEPVIEDVKSSLKNKIKAWKLDLASASIGGLCTGLLIFSFEYFMKNKKLI